MAYSSIGHMGYALIGFAAGSQQGVAGVLIYLVIYMITTVGTFICILIMRRNGKAVENVEDLAGLSQHDQTTRLPASPSSSSASSASRRSPASWASGSSSWPRSTRSSTSLAVIGFVTSVIGAYYYLRIIKVMFFDKPAAPLRKAARRRQRRLARGLRRLRARLRRAARRRSIDAAAAAAKSLFP